MLPSIYTSSEKHTRLGLRHLQSRIEESAELIRLQSERMKENLALLRELQQFNKDNWSEAK